MRIVEKLEKDGAGTQSDLEVRDGMLNHQTSPMPQYLRGQNSQAFRQDSLHKFRL